MKKKPGTAFYIFLIIFLVFILFPFYYIFLTSIRKPAEIYSTFNLYTLDPSIQSYISAFTVRPFGRYLINSMIIAGGTTILCIIIASFAAYATARLRFRGKSLLLGVVLAVSMFPQIAIISPMYIFLKDMGLRNTHLGLIIPYISFSLPLAIWYLTTFFKDIPFSLEEAAKIDGASPFKAFYLVIAPLAAPGVFTTAILVFIGAWNEYLFAYTLNTDDYMRTVTVGITMFNAQYTIPWGDISAAAVIVTVPLIAMVLIFQKRIVSGLTSGAVKG
jgi:multiple sugar transport system permease protein